ncbi:membrane protein containing DUF81 [Candidatus Magnetoovum chiemensis]|nr:membrane protein containing DUF81 [Candidatus Magnetoovum chiemensis]
MSEIGLFATLFSIGFIGAFLSGMLGLGGAIVLVPMLLYIPPMIGAYMLDMKEVAGITIIVVFASSLSALFIHKRNRLVLKSLALVMGISAVLASFFGALYSKHTSSAVLLLIFACMASFAAIIMFLPKREQGDDIALEDIRFNKKLAFIIAMTVGFIGGMVGAPGAYIFTPLMIYFLKIPTKVAIGSTMGIVFLASISGTAGKLLTGQVPYLMSAAVVAGAVPAARLGALLTKRVPANTLRKVLALIIAFAAARMWLDVLVK